MTHPRVAVLRSVAFASARGIGFLAVAVGAGFMLRAIGLWYPEALSDWVLVAVMCAMSLALWRHWPLMHLIVIAALVVNPWWLFSDGRVRAIPLVIAAYLVARAGLRLWISLPVVMIAVVLSQNPGWPQYVGRPISWLRDFYVEIGRAHV